MPEASFCPFCGTPLASPPSGGQLLAADRPSQAGGASSVPPAGSALATWSASGVHPAPPAQFAQPTPPAPAPAALPTFAWGPGPAAAPAPTAQWRCQWCGAKNPGGADRCVACGAAYPSPEQDAAIARAAEERIRSVTDSLEAMRRRRGFGRFFGR